MLGYLITGNLIGKASWKVWKEGRGGRFLPILLFPISAWGKNVGKEGNAPIADFSNKELYINLSTLFGPIKLPLHALIILPFFIVNSVSLLTNMPNLALMGIGRTVKGVSALLSRHRQKRLPGADTDISPEQEFELLAQLERQHQELGDEIKERREKLRGKMLMVPYRRLPPH